MDATKVQCLTSLRWFVQDHAEELPASLRSALCNRNGTGKCSNAELLERIQALSSNELWQLCSAIEQAPRSYFGSLSARELISCLEKGC
jgi:hypothetical protein